jgi:hypothetical protein
VLPCSFMPLGKYCTFLRIIIRFFFNNHWKSSSKWLKNILMYRLYYWSRSETSPDMRVYGIYFFININEIYWYSKSALYKKFNGFHWLIFLLRPCGRGNYWSMDNTTYLNICFNISLIGEGFNFLTDISPKLVGWSFTSLCWQLEVIGYSTKGLLSILTYSVDVDLNFYDLYIMYDELFQLLFIPSRNLHFS